MPKRERTLCAQCDEPSAVKMMTVYWAWTWGSGDRRCWKQWYDFECAAKIVPKLQALDNTDSCFLCEGIAASIEDANLYATYYIPGRDRMDAFLTVHDACLSGSEQYFTQNGRRMPDREKDARGNGQAPRRNPWDSWEAMGLSPS